MPIHSKSDTCIKHLWRRPKQMCYRTVRKQVLRQSKQLLRQACLNSSWKQVLRRLNSS